MKTFNDIQFQKDEAHDVLFGNIFFDNGFEMKIKQLFVDEKNKLHNEDPGEWFLSIRDQENKPVVLPGILTMDYLTKTEVTKIMIMVQ